MFNLNLCLWNSTNLHTFKLMNIDLEHTVSSLKLKIMDIFRINEIDGIELVRCGNIMKNGDKISTYIMDNDGIVFVIISRNDSMRRARKHTEKELSDMLTDYNDAFKCSDFKETLLNAIKPETIMTLLANIPELSSDSISLSIIKDPVLLKTLLDPGAIKTQIEKHPALLFAAHYLIKNVLQGALDKKRSYSHIHFTDEDFSEGDDIEISYSEQFSGRPDTTGYSVITSSQLASALQNATRSNETRSENEGVFQIPVIANSFLEGALRDVLNDQNNLGNGSDIDSSDNIDGFNRTSLTHQLHQMHEVGLANDLLNFRALDVAEGDVQGAIELILNGLIE